MENSPHSVGGYADIFYRVPGAKKLTGNTPMML